MPIEIKELHIKINVDSNSNSQSESVTQNEVSKGLMKDYVEQVMNIEKRKKER